MASNAELFEGVADWMAMAKKNGYLKTSGPDGIPVLDMDLAANRAHQTVSEAEWVKNHPLTSVGYTSELSTVKVRDGAGISVKLSAPTRLLTSSKDGAKEKLPVLFVTHGGGWIQGTHITEEAWLLWPLYEHFDLCIVSVEYRLAPEAKPSIWMDDSWDVLEQLISSPEAFLSNFGTFSKPDSALGLDIGRLMLAGSSAGAGIAEYLSQTCRDKNVPVYGAILNVPVTCDYRHLPANCLQPQNSYEQCTHGFLSSGQMRWVWDTVVSSSTAGSDPKISPLLGNLKDLPRHLVFIAGQDPLRDEGIAYAKKLETEGVEVKSFVYPGVPHSFAEFWELKATQKFWVDIRSALKEWLA